jgi:rhodanese-related sulfurtransferase
MSEKLIVKQLSSTECWNIVERLSGLPFRDTSAEGKCLVILDVRTAQEYDSGHLKGSINLDFKSPSFKDQVAGLDRNKAYLIYCRTGVRSARAVMLMRSLGFWELYDLTGGFIAWRSEGFESVSD